MGHTKPETIVDIKHELETIRSLDGVRERSPGVFYYKSTAFLHFHDKDGSRWADVKTPPGYKKVVIEFSASTAAKRRFLKAVKDAHAALANHRRR